MQQKRYATLNWVHCADFDSHHHHQLLREAIAFCFHHKEYNPLSTTTKKTPHCNTHTHNLNNMISSQNFQHIPILSICFDDHATVEELFQVAAIMTVFWLVFFYLFCQILRPVIKGREWLMDAGSRDYDRGGKELMETIGNPLSREEFVDEFQNMWPWSLAVCLQHFVSGIMAVPSLMNMGEENLQNGLVCLAIVSEMGWEIGDLIGWIYQRYFTKGGKKKVPIGIIIMMAVHHSLNMILGIPMILNYRDNRYFHWLVFDLQAAAAVALLITEYTKMLNVSKPKQLFQFQLFTGVSLAVMVWTRVFDWVYNCFMLIKTFYQDDAMAFFYVGIFSALIFTSFSVLICIIPCYQRFMKFLKKKAEYKSLPASADPKIRRASMLAMQDAAADVLSNHTSMQEELLELLQSTKRTPHKSNRRDTIPPSFTRGKRSSVNMKILRSSMGNLDTALLQLQIAGGLKDLKMD